MVILLLIICNLIIFNYILHLQKNDCECAKNWKQNIIKYLAIFNIIYSIFILVFHKNINILSNKTIIFLNIIKFIQIFYYICVLLYFAQLKNKLNCICSENWKRKYLLFPIFFPILLLLLLSFK